MLLPLYHHHQQPLTLPETLRGQIFPPFPVSKALISRCYVRRANSVVVHCSASDRKTLPQSAIQRIAEKLRSLGVVEEKHVSPAREITGETSGKNSPREIFVPFPSQLPIHRVGHTIDTSWSTPSYSVPKPGSGTAISRCHELKRVWKKETEIERKEEKVPSLAELTLPPAELRRLRTEGMRLTKKLKIGKVGITEGIVNGIHERWRTTEVVKIFCEDISRMNMKRTHDVMEWLTGGTLLSRDKDFIVLYRGKDFLPSAVSSAIEERRRQTMIMEKSNVRGNELMENEQKIPQVATDEPEVKAEYKVDHTQAHQMKPRQRKSTEPIFEKTSIKLSMSLEKKKQMQEKILAELESREIPQQSDIDKEGITDDEKYMLLGLLQISLLTLRFVRLTL